MQSDYRVKEIFTDENTGDVIALCVDVLYQEEFEKFLGQGDTFDGKENASNLLKDSNYEISDKIRADIEDIFGVKEFDDEQDYDGYQFYDFGDDEFEDDEEEFEDEEFAVPTRLLKRESFNLREALNTIDLNTYNKYDLLNLYEACDLSENEKRALANIVYDQNDPSVIYDTLNDRFLGKEIEMPERVKDGVIHEDLEDVEFVMSYYMSDLLISDIGPGKYEASYRGNDSVSVIVEFDTSYDEFVYTIDGEGPYSHSSYEYIQGDIERALDSKLRKNESKSIKEDFYRGNKSVQFIGHGEWNDPELEYKGYLFNYWNIEDALWNDFLEETGYSDAQSDDPTVEEQFNKFVQDRASDLLDDCIYGGSFTGLSVEGEIMDFPNDDYFYVGYDYKTEELSLDNAYNTGRTPEYSIKYDFSKSIDENLQALYDYAIEKSPWLSDDEDLDESVDEFEFDDEFNAYYDGYTSELTPEEKKLIILANDMGHWGDDFTDEGNPESKSNLAAYNKAMEKAKKIAKEKGMSLVDFTNSLEDEGLNESNETSTENNVIKIRPNSKMREIDIEDKSEVGDPSHPIQVGLRGRVNKLR